MKKQPLNTGIDKFSPWELKPFVDKHQLEGAIVIAVRDDMCRIMSYGTNKAQCARFGRTVDQIRELISDGKIEFE